MTPGGRPQRGLSRRRPESWPLSAFPEGFDRAPQASHRLSAARLTDPVLPRRPSRPGETFEIVATPAVAPPSPDRFFHVFLTWLAGFLCSADRKSVV